MEYKAEDYIRLIEQGRFDKVGNWAMEVIAKEYRSLQEQLDVSDVCPRCNGTGKDGLDRCDSTNWYICEICNGTGRSERWQ